MKALKILLKGIFISLGVAATIHFSLLILDGLLNQSIEKLNFFKILQLELFWNYSFFDNSLLGFISIGLYYLTITTIILILDRKRVSE